MPAYPDSNIARQSLRSETRSFFICLLTIIYPSLAEPIRLSNDMTQLYDGDYESENGDPVYCTVSQGQTYFSTQFTFLQPSAPNDGSIPRARLIISNVDRRIVQAIRDMHQAAKVKAAFVSSDDLDLVEYETPLLTLDNVEYDAAQISGELIFAHFLENQCPSLTFSPNLFPALFK